MPQVLWWHKGNLVCSNARLFKDIEELRAETRCGAIYLIADISPQLLIFRVVNGGEAVAHHGDPVAAEHAVEYVPVA